jgi:superfamily II DNA or RNA helicase
VIDPHLQFDPRSNLDERLCRAAEGLLEAGCVSEVRLHQNGSVITGIVRGEPLAAVHGGRHRVYIRRANGSPGLHAECSCGAPGICVHAAAVSIAASSPGQEVPLPARAPALLGRLDAPSADAGLRASRAAPQQLLYLLESDADSTQAPACGMLQLTIWIGAASAARPDESIEAVAFAPRAARRRGQYPRYVGERDESVLEMLLSQRSDGPWSLQGRSGARVVQRVMASGRAFWGSLRSPPLREGAPRRARLSWRIEESGEQHLAGHVDDSAAVLLRLEPAIYVDVATREWGVVELPCSQALVDRYAGRRVSPEQVHALIDELDGEANITTFPRPARLVIERQSLSGLRARLNLGAGAEARQQYLYNGAAVDSQCLDAHGDYVRIVVSGMVREIPRDREREKALAARLASVLPQRPSGCDAWLSFVLDAAPALESEGWEIVIEAGFPFRLAHLDRWFGELESASHDDWFSLQLGAMVDGRPVNLLSALAAYLQDSAAGESVQGSAPIAAHEPSSLQIGEHWLMRLEDGRYLPIGMDRIRRIAAMLVELFDPDGLDDQRRLVMPRAQRYRLAPLLEFGEVTLRSSEPAVRELAGEINELTAIEPVAVPEGFRAELRPYQCEGLAWLQFLRRHRLGGLLADDMGLGKTVQAVAHLLLEKDAGRLQRPALIVAPVSALANWQHEIQHFAPALRWLTLHGPGRRERFAAIASADVVITGYPQLQLDTDLLLEQDFYMVILDEAQLIKNPRARVSQVARALRTEHRLCLTGTPVENHLGELWALFAFAEPRLLGEERQFQRQYRAPIERGGDRLRAESLAERLAPCLLRRTKDAVARELPPKSEMIETIVLDERQRDFYDAIRLASHRRLREILERQGLARSQITILDTLLKLRQACCDPRLVAAGGANETIPSAKLDWLATALPELAADGRRILLFSQFTSMLRLIEAKVRELEIPYCLLTGETRERAAQVERFQAGGAPLFLISLKAGGTALNLTAADTVIHYDPWWNPAAEAQATDRAHRIGQERPVFVYKLIAQNTVEERMLALQEEKRALAAGIYASGAGSPLALSEADLERLLTE